nr:hypothetical protein 1 [Desulfobacteraceae bacterium]
MSEKIIRTEVTGVDRYRVMCAECGASWTVPIDAEVAQPGNCVGCGKELPGAIQDGFRRFLMNARERNEGFSISIESKLDG